MALPLLALGTMALAAPAYKWAERQKMELRREAEALDREDYSKAHTLMREGLDLTTPAGRQEYQTRLMNDPRTASMGSSLWANELQRQQQNDQWQWGNENLTAAQQASIAEQQASRAQQAAQAEAQLALQRSNADRSYNLQEREFNSLDAARKAEAERTARMGGFTGPQLAQAAGELDNKIQKVMEPYKNAQNIYTRASNFLTMDNPIAVSAALTDMVKLQDEGSTVSLPEAETRKVAGWKDQLQAYANLAKGKGLSEGQKRDAQQVLDNIISTQAYYSERELNNLRQYANPDPYSGRPALNPRIFDPYNDPLYFRPLDQKQKIAGQAFNNYASGVVNNATGGVIGVQGKGKLWDPQAIDDAFSKRDKTLLGN